MTTRTVISFLATALVVLGLALAAAGGQAQAAELAQFTVTIRAGAGEAIAPGVWVVSHPPYVLFSANKPASPELARLAEAGDREPLLAMMRTHEAMTSFGAFAPGRPFTVTARPGDRLAFVTKYGTSGTMFLAPKNGGFVLFAQGGRANMGNWASRVALYDTGAPGAHAPIARAAAAPGTPALPPTHSLITVEIHPMLTPAPQG